MQNTWQHFQKGGGNWPQKTSLTQVFTVTTNAENTLQHFEGASALCPPYHCLRAPIVWLTRLGLLLNREMKTRYVFRLRYIHLCNTTTAVYRKSLPQLIPNVSGNAYAIWFVFPSPRFSVRGRQCKCPPLFTNHLSIDPLGLNANTL